MSGKGVGHQTRECSSVLIGTTLLGAETFWTSPFSSASRFTWMAAQTQQR